MGHHRLSFILNSCNDFTAVKSPELTPNLLRLAVRVSRVLDLLPQIYIYEVVGTGVHMHIYI